MKAANDTYRLAVVGPESSGKSSAVDQIARELADFGLSVGVVAEAGRVFAAELALDHIWTMADELAIGRLHLDLFKAAMKDSKVIICDGAVITPRVWSLRAFGAELPELVEIDDTNEFDLIALAAPDLPWQPDPLRTNPANREIDFKLYWQLLGKSEVPVVSLTGSGPKRLTSLRQALTALNTSNAADAPVALDADGKAIKTGSLGVIEPQKTLS